VKKISKKLSKKSFCVFGAVNQHFNGACQLRSFVKFYFFDFFDVRLLVDVKSEFFKIWCNSIVSRDFGKMSLNGVVLRYMFGHQTSMTTFQKKVEKWSEKSFCNIGAVNQHF